MSIATVTLLCAAALGGCASAAHSSGSASGGKTYVIRYGGVEPASDPNTTAQNDFAQLVSQLSKGRIKVEVYPNSELGAITSEVTATETDSQQMMYFAPAYLTGQVPQLSVLTLPFLFTSATDAFQKLDGKAGTDLDQFVQQESNLMVLAYQQFGFVEVIDKNGPVNTPADMKGLKVRVIPASITSQILSALGADPIGIDNNELFTALQTGTVDADTSPVTSIVSQKEYEIAHYLSLLNLYYNPAVVAVNKSFFDSLPSDLQSVVRQAAQQAAKQEISTSSSQIAADIQQMEQAGTKVNNVSQQQLSAFRDETQPLYQKFSGQYGATLVNEFTGSGE
jgi:tripartite ATP-independent transporter DctP family solute receptor